MGVGFNEMQFVEVAQLGSKKKEKPPYIKCNSKETIYFVKERQFVETLCALINLLVIGVGV
jgi:hypothetical protein